MRVVREFDANGDGKPGDLLGPDGLLDPRRFDVQGHRGARGLRPENTLPAIEAALDLLVPTLEMDATIMESHKIDAMPHYKDGRGYQPSVVYWVEQDLIVADEFRDGNVPAGMRPLNVIRRGFDAVPETVTARRFRADSACTRSTRYAGSCQDAAPG